MSGAVVPRSTLNEWHMLSRAIKSTKKYVLHAHGETLETKFKVPRGIVLVFLTYPGTLFYAGSKALKDLVKNETTAKNLILSSQLANFTNKTKTKYYSVTYLPGDVVQDMHIGLTDETQPRTIFTRHKTRLYGLYEYKYRENPNNRGLPNVRIPWWRSRQTTTLSSFLRWGVPKSWLSDTNPVVIFMATCRGCIRNDERVLQNTQNLNRTKLARVGVVPPRVTKSFIEEKKTKNMYDQLLYNRIIPENLAYNDYVRRIRAGTFQGYF